MYEDKPLDDLSYYEFYTLDNNNVRNKGAATSPAA